MNILLNPAPIARRAVLVPILAALALLAIASPPAQAAYPGDNGRIAFAKRGASQAVEFDIVTMLPSGLDAGAETAGSNSDTNPAYSPDGELIAFTHRSGGPTTIHLMEEDGDAPHPIIASSIHDVTQPTWSPNGRLLAFAIQMGDAQTGSNFDILSARFGETPGDLTNQRWLVRSPADDFAPAWSPNGDRIAFVSERDGNGEIYSMRRDGTRERNLTKLPDSYESQPAFSPNGSTLALESDLAGNHDIYAMPATGGELDQLTDDPASDLGAAWAPNGGKIAFQSFRDGDSEIFTMRRDGSRERQRTENAVVDTQPDWQPR